MKYFTVIAITILISSIPIFSIEESTYPAWYFTGATLNYSAYDYYGLNSTPNMIWNFSYKITYTINGYFNYTYYKKIDRNSTLVKSNGTVEDPNGFPALNLSNLELLNRGNASFISKISLPGINSIKVIKNVTVATFSGNVLSNEIILHYDSLINGERIIYLNYSEYSGVLLNEKILNVFSSNITLNYFMVTYTNIPLYKVTLTQVFLEFIIAIIFVIALIYFFRRYRKIHY
ncbi:MAG: hypothetical protein ACP5TO_07315 [Thermoplasmata archaeon]